MIRRYPKVPGDRVTKEFEHAFAVGGWELIELLFGKRTDVHRKWIRETGAQCRRPRKVGVAA